MSLLPWVRATVTELEGFEDQVVIDSVIRRLADVELSREAFEAHLQVLLEDRTTSFCLRLWRFMDALSDKGVSERALLPISGVVAAPPSRQLAEAAPAAVPEPSEDRDDDDDEPPDLERADTPEGDAAFDGPTGGHVLAQAGVGTGALSLDPPVDKASHLENGAIAGCAAPNGAASPDPLPNGAPVPPCTVTTGAECPLYTNEEWVGCLPAAATAAVCAMSGDGYGYEQHAWINGVPPPPLYDAEMSEEEVARLQEWLTEAAHELYDGSEEDEATQLEVEKLVQRGTTILQNSQLTASVFGLVKREGATRRAPGHASLGGAAANTTTVVGSRGATWQPRGLDRLPAPHRALLDAPTLDFMAELWEVLKRDEPQTAAAMLRPDDGEESEDGEEDEEHAHAHGGEAPARGAGAEEALLLRGCMCEMEQVRGWVEKRVLQVQGFADQVVIDAVCRFEMVPMESMSDSLCFLLTP